MNELFVSEGMTVRRASLVYNTREVFGRFSNYYILFNGCSAKSLSDRLQIWSKSNSQGVFQTLPNDRQQSASLFTIVLSSDQYAYKTMAFFERMLFQGSEKYGELIMHVSVDGLKNFCDSIDCVEAAIQKQFDFDFRFHPYECDFVSQGLASLTICGGEEWVEKLGDFEKRDEEPLIEWQTSNRDMDEYFELAKKYAALF